MKTKLVLFIKSNKGYYLLLLLISLFFHLNHPLDADEGVILSGAWHMLNNKALYLDFFEIIVPGSFYLIYWGFKIFGANYYTAKIISLLMVFISAIFIYKISNLISKNRFRYIPPIIFITAFSFMPIINHNLHSTFFAVISIYLFLLTIKSKQKNKNVFLTIFMAGLLGGLTTIFLQHKGLVLSCASMLFLLITWFQSKKIFNFYKIIFYFIGFAIPVLMVLLKWPLSLLYNNLILFSLGGYLDVNKTPYTLLIISLIILAYFSFVLVRKKDPRINYLLFVQFFLIISALPLPDLYHLLLILFPLLSLSSLLIYKNAPGVNKAIISLLLLFFSISFLINLGSFSFLYSYKNENPSWIKEVEESCLSEYTYSGPFLPNIYFEFKKINATPFGLLIERGSTPEQFEEGLKHLKKKDPDCVFLSYYPNIIKKFKHTGDNPVENYIKENYEPFNKRRFIQVYKK